MPPRILVALSGHGFGHLAQTAAVFERLLEMQPETRITVRSSLPEPVLRNRFPGPFDYQPAEPDRGMVMKNALEVDLEASWEWYRAFHADYPARVAAEAKVVASLGPDLVFANVPYLSIAAAAAAEVPAVALCSINWAEIFHIYCGGRPGAGEIHAEILESYRAAKPFLLPEPSAPMPGLENARPIGPVGQHGRDRGKEIRQRLGLDPGTRLALFGLGGIPTDLHGGEWSAGERLHWIVPANLGARLPNATPEPALGIPFLDLVASVDLVVTKTGYGTIVEAALAGTPVLCAERGDGWPEEPGLFAWMRVHGTLRVIGWERLRRGDFHRELDELLAVGRGPSPELRDGAREAAETLLALVGQT